jgi:hypothetical protein
MKPVSERQLQDFIKNSTNAIGAINDRGKANSRVIAEVVARLTKLEKRVDALDATGRALEDEDGTKGGDLDPLTPRNQG